MIRFNEYRYLIPVRCYYNEGMNCFVFKFNGKTLSVKNVEDSELVRVFRLSKMKDEETEPRSARGKTYTEMVQSIKDGTDRINYIWSNYEQLFIQEMNALVTASQEKKDAGTL